MDVFLTERLAIELDSKIAGKRLNNIFSTSKEEINFEFEDFVLKINFYQGQPFFQTPDVSKLQKKNRQPIFRELKGFCVQRVFPYLWDRIFAIQFENNTILRMYNFGKFSQITLYINQQWHATFPVKSKSIEFENKPNDDLLPWLDKSADHLRFLLPRQRQYLIDEGYDQIPMLQKQVLLQTIREEALQSKLYIHKSDSTYRLLSHHEEPSIASFDGCLDALDQFSRLYIAHHVYTKTKAAHLFLLNKELKRIQAKIKSATIQMDTLHKAGRYQDKADLIMANLWQMEKGQSEINLPTFDGEQMVHITLKKDLSPQANAARLYKKGKNEKIRLTYAKKTFEDLHAKLADKLLEIEAAEKMEGLKELRKEWYVKQNKANIKLPYRLIHFQGFEIRVGKGARENDELLRYHTTKTDHWLHAKDVSGSHVIIRNPNKQDIPQSVIEKAAQVAAHYSKAKSEGLAAVMVTERKYVRKPKGAHPGMVKVDHAETVMVTPGL